MVAGFVPSTAVGASRSARSSSASTTAARCAMSAGSEPGSRPRSRATSMRASSRCVCASSPFSNRLTADQARQVRFVRPELVAEVDVPRLDRRRISAARLFRGLREDKPASEIVRESPGSEASRRSGRTSTERLTHPDRLYWPDDGRDQAGPRGLLRRGLAPHGAVRRRAAARAGALPRRRQRPAVFPEARLEGPQRRHRAGDRSRGGTSR